MTVQALADHDPSVAPARGSDHAYEPAVVDRRGPGRSTALTLLLGGALVSLLVAVDLLPPAWSGSLAVGTGMAFAAIGVVALFAFTLGLVSPGARTAGDLFARALADSDRSGVLVTDGDGRVLYANRAYADMTGALRAGDVRSVERVFARSGDGEEAIYRLNRQAAAGRPGSCDVRVVDHPGLAGAGESGARWYRVSCRPLPASPDLATRGRLVAWRVSDVTHERVAQERTFQELRDVVGHFDNAPAGFLAANEDGRIGTMNATLARWTGIDLATFEPGTLSLADLLDGVPPNETVLDDGSRTADVELRTPKGGSFVARLHTVSVAGDAAWPVRTLVLDRAALVPDDAPDAAMLFAANPMAVAALAKDGRVTRSNPAFAAAFKGEGALPATIDEIADEEGAQALRDAFETAMDGRTAAPVELAVRGGAVIRAHLAAPTSDRRTDDEAVLLYALEITEQRALERQMAQGQKMQAVGQLAGGIAHDFNNVLTAIIGFSDLLLDNHKASDRSYHDIVAIRQSAEKASSLVRQLLAFSRRQTLRPRILSIPDVLSEASIMLRRLTGEKIRLDIKHGRDLWPVKADLGQLEQVIVNLCVNARDAINAKVEGAQARNEDPGEGVITIRTRNLSADAVRDETDDVEVAAADYLVLEVTDTGTGMSKGTLAQVFEPFFSTKEPGKGTGLGLSTVYGIVKQSGGFVLVSSAVGVGTTFRILLPRTVPTVEELRAEADAPAEKARDLSGSATIVFVEDMDPVRAVGVRTLQSRGYTVHEAENGEEALELIEELGDAVDLVVSDVMMPEMDGPTLFRHVQAIRPNLPFIFASGYAEEAFEKSLPNAQEAEFAFLTKPYSLSDLATLVKETLEDAPAKAA